MDDESSMSAASYQVKMEFAEGVEGKEDKDGPRDAEISTKIRSPGGTEADVSTRIDWLKSDMSRGISPPDMITSSEFLQRSFDRDDAAGNETPSNKKRLAAGGMSNFIKASRRDEYSHEKSEYRRRAGQLLSSPYVANFMVLVVMIDSAATCADIDARAVGKSVQQWIAVVSEICLVLYTVELVLLLSLKGIAVLKKDMLMVVDLVIIACGYAELILGQFFPSDMLDLRLLRTLRFLRIIRLLRLLRKIHGLRELQKLVIMMATCLKTLLWSFLFCFVIMTVWAMLMVEMVHPLIEKVHQEGIAFMDCAECVTAASSVMHANLLLFKTVIAGDSWGQIAVPVIQEYPATGIIFMGSLLTIVFGVLNLIVAVVVDTFAEARERDVLNLAEEMERNHENDKKFLQKVFEHIDEDGSGELTLDELVEGARKDPEFQSRLRVMDIDEVDLQQLFEMIDVDGSGSIEAAEFIAPLSRWVHDSKTAPRFIKYNMLRSMQQQDELYRQSHYHYNALSTRIEDLTSTVETLLKPTCRGPRASCVVPSVPGGMYERMHSSEMDKTDVNDVRNSALPSEATGSLDHCDEIDHREKYLVHDLGPDEPAEHEHVDGPEQPQASMPLEWKDVSRSRNRLSSDESTVSRAEGGRPGESAVDVSDIAKAFSANSKLLKAAMESLEKTLMASTESALRKSMAMVEYALHEEMILHRGRHRSSIAERDSSKFTALFGRTPRASQGESQRMSSSRRSLSFDPGASGAQSPPSVPSGPATPKESETPRPTEDQGERIHRSRRRVNTHEVPMHFSRRVARHSFANAHLQFSAKV